MCVWFQIKKEWEQRENKEVDIDSLPVPSVPDCFQSFEINRGNSAETIISTHLNVIAVKFYAIKCTSREVRNGRQRVDMQRRGEWEKGRMFMSEKSKCVKKSLVVWGILDLHILHHLVANECIVHLVVRQRMHRDR